MDGTILVWDVGGEDQRQDKPGVRPDQQRVNEWWSDLAGDDAAKAYSAIWGLAAVPQQAVPLLARNLSPTPGTPADRIRRLIDDLDSSEFERREAAAHQLAELEERAFPALNEALEAKPSVEKRRHLEALLNVGMVVRTSATLRSIRSIEVLEHIGTAEARQLLESLAKGAPEARLTLEAKASLERLAKRPAQP
jgi:hypothetical protein